MDINLGSGIEINLRELLHTLLRKLWLIILVGILCAVGAGFYSTYLLTPLYTSTASLYIISKQQGSTTTLYDLQTGSILAKDYMILIKSRPVMEEVIRTLGLNMSSAELSQTITVYSPQDTRVLYISVMNSDPDTAKLLVDTICEVSAERMVSIMGMEKVNIVEEGDRPYTPSSPDIKKNIVIAGGGGVLITSFFVILIFLLNDSIRSSEDIEKYLGLTTLGFIPLETANKKKKTNKVKKLKNAA